MALRARAREVAIRLGPHLQPRRLALDALEMAIWTRRDEDLSGLVHLAVPLHQIRRPV